jgi:hypothetical protein
MTAAVNAPVLVGPVPLFFVQSLTISEGYRIERIMGSRFSQVTQPTATTITIEAVLLGPGRVVQKKALEELALSSRQLAATAAEPSAAVGTSVVCGMTISLDMQITDLRFVQSVAKSDALDVSITLQQVPRPTSAAVGDVADVKLAPATSAVPSAPTANPIARSPGAPI